MSLASLSDVKTHLGITNANSDPVLQMLLDGASAAVLSWLGRNLELQNYTETANGNGKAKLLLQNTPVAGLTYVFINGQEVPIVGDFTSAGCRFTETALILQGGQVFTAGEANISIKYDAGHDPVPADIQQAVMLTVAHRFKERDWTGYSSKSLAGETVSFQTLAPGLGQSIANGGFPPAALGILANYKRVGWP